MELAANALKYIDRERGEAELDAAAVLPGPRAPSGARSVGRGTGMGWRLNTQRAQIPCRGMERNT